MSKIKNCGYDQYGAELFEQQQFGTAGIEGANANSSEVNDIGIIKARHKVHHNWWIASLNINFRQYIMINTV